MALLRLYNYGGERAVRLSAAGQSKQVWRIRGEGVVCFLSGAIAIDFDLVWW